MAFRKVLYLVNHVSNYLNILSRIYPYQETIHMENTPGLDGKYLGTVTEDFAKVSDTLKEASYQIKVRKISDYPIFVFTESDAALGSLLIGRGEGQEVRRNIRASFLEEFEQRNLIEPGEGVKNFKAAYKDPEEFCCLFVLDKTFTNFIFLPYPDDDK